MSDTGGSNAGWHIDPNNPSVYRYYDGSAWTDHTAPAVAPAAPAAVDPYGGRQATPSAGYPYAAVPTVDPRRLSRIAMILSLISLGSLVLPILSPLAIAGLVVGIIASQREPQGKSFWLTGILVGAAVIVLSILLIVVAVAVYTTQRVT